jgi:UDP-N-acetylglucosamine:LPS N-acetylglucosamine transferase
MLIRIFSDPLALSRRAAAAHAFATPNAAGKLADAVESIMGRAA